MSVLSQPKDCSAPDCEPVNVGPALFNLPANQTNQIDQQTNPDNNKDIFNNNAMLVPSLLRQSTFQLSNLVKTHFINSVYFSQLLRQKARY